MAKQSLENHEKRCTAGLIASTGKFALDLEILAYARHTKEVQDAMLHEKQIKAKDAYDALRTNVEAVRLTKLPPDKWTSTDLSTIILWYKRPNDSAIPKKNR